MTSHQRRPADWQMYVLILDTNDARMHAHVQTVSWEHPRALAIQCRALISFFFFLQLFKSVPMPKSPRDRFCRDSQCFSHLGIILRVARTKSLLSFDLKMLGHSKGVLRAHTKKRPHHSYEDGVVLSFHVLEKWDDGLHSAQIHGLFSLGLPNASQSEAQNRKASSIKKTPPRIFLDLSAVMSHNREETWIRADCVVLFIAALERLHQKAGVF